MSDMAELLEPTGEVQAERRTYPWAEWLDGSPRRLKPSDSRTPGDFDPDPRNFVSYIYSQARRAGLKVVLTVEPDDCIVMQSYNPLSHPRPKLPSPYRRLANGQVDRTAPTGRGSEPRHLREGEACRHCGRKLTPFGRAYGECRQVKNDAFRCPENPEPNAGFTAEDKVTDLMETLTRSVQEARAAREEQ